MSSIDVEDWDTGQTITITLDPRQTAVQCAEGFYKKGGWGSLPAPLSFQAPLSLHPMLFAPQIQEDAPVGQPSHAPPGEIKG